MAHTNIKTRWRYGGSNVSLLFDEHPLVLSPTLAKVLGNLNEAVFIQQVHYWLEIKKQTGKNFVEGRYWIYNSVEAWLKQFPWMSSATLRRTIDNLVDKGFVIKGNFNRRKMDHTTWYTLDYEKILEVDKRIRFENEEAAQFALAASQLEEASEKPVPLIPEALTEQVADRIAQKEQIELSKQADRIDQNEQIDLPKMSRSNCSKRADRIAQNEQSNTIIDYPEINQETTTTETMREHARSPAEVADVLEAYNRLCPSFPKALSLTPKRAESIHALFSDGISLPEIEEAFRRAEQSDFLTGRAKGANWNRFDFDWFIQPANIIRLLEGKYDNIPVQKQIRIAQNQEWLKKTMQDSAQTDSLVLKPVSQYPLFLQEALQRHPPVSGKEAQS